MSAPRPVPAAALAVVAGHRPTYLPRVQGQMSQVGCSCGFAAKTPNQRSSTMLNAWKGHATKVGIDWRSVEGSGALNPIYGPEHESAGLTWDEEYHARRTPEYVAAEEARIAEAQAERARLMALPHEIVADVVDPFGRRIVLLACPVQSRTHSYDREHGMRCNGCNRDL